MLVDEIKIYGRAGKGGDGVARWLNEKGKEFSGPSGGNGGKGGDIYAVAVQDIGLLIRYRNLKEFAAEPGEAGTRNSRAGKKGNDLEIKLPVGSIITNTKTHEIFSLDYPGQKIMILAGGQGGLGNEQFKSSTNRTPKEFTLGKSGEEAELFIELELIADAGFIGLPNAGKSSLLNVLTNAKAKIGNFEFTTLEPNLGSFHGFVLADIPGLIEGASEGRGLGHKFLKHIKRTKILFHCISAEQENLEEAYSVIRDELKRFDESLMNKKEVLILTKIDMLDEKTLKEKKKLLQKLNKDLFFVTILSDESVEELEAAISKELSGS